MRAGLFLEGFARCFDVSVLVVPVLGEVAPADDFVSSRAAGFAVLELPEIDPVAEAQRLLATPAGRARMEATHPLPSVCARAGEVACDAVASAFGRRAFAAVHVMRLYLAPFVERVLELPAGERPFLSLDVDDDDASVCTQLGFVGEAIRFERLAEWALPQFDLVVTASSEDRELLAIPNAVPTPQQGEREPGPGPRLLFVGDFAWAPNVDAARRLCHEILPALQAIAPTATASIVGARPPAFVRDLEKRPGVTVTSDVADVSPHYRVSDVAVVPLAAGGGSRTKIVEAFAHRVPVVTTAIGAHGLDDTDGLLMRAETAEEFVAQIVRLEEDATLRGELLDAAEHAYRTRFAYGVVADSIASAWSSRVRDRVTVTLDERG